MKWTKDMFRALAAVAWAEGGMKAEEATALQRAATALGLDAADRAAVDAMIATPTSLDGFAATGIAPADAEYLYALACLVSVADGNADLAERECITKLGALLSLSADACRRGEAAAAIIASQLGLEANVFEALAGQAER